MLSKAGHTPRTHSGGSSATQHQRGQLPNQQQDRRQSTSHGQNSRPLTNRNDWRQSIATTQHQAPANSQELVNQNRQPHSHTHVPRIGQNSSVPPTNGQSAGLNSGRSGHQPSQGSNRHGRPIYPYPPSNDIKLLLSKTSAIEERLRKLEDQSVSLKDSVDELKSILEKYLHSSCAIKGSIYEVCVKKVDIILYYEYVQRILMCFQLLGAIEG